MALTPIPSDFGQGGANISPTGSKPRLRELLVEHKAAIEAGYREYITQRAQGIISETAMRQVLRSATAAVSGTVYFAGVPLLAGDVLSNVTVILSAAGTSLTLCKVGLFSPSGVLLASTADQSAGWASTGVKTSPFTLPYTVTAEGLYYVGMIAVFSGTAVQFNGANLSGITISNAQIGTGQLPWGVQLAQADLPSQATIVVGGSGVAACVYAALS